jgi:tRNA(Ile)-lysidine synthase
MALDDDLIRRVGSAIARARLLAAGEPVLALVSGGADSTLLAHALHALGHPLETLHIAHGLRGAESAADAEACRALAARLGVPHREVDGPVAHGPGTEARARLRRRAAADAVRAGRAVATGHTRDDRVETILYRLAASPGGAAFAALPAADGDGRIRPLLELGREEVRGALRRAGIGWRDDSSNGDRSFARNRVRLDLLPAFRSLHPAAEGNLLRTAALLAEDDAALDSLAAELLHEGGGLCTAAAAAAPPAVLRRALRRLAGFPAPRPVAAERVGALARSRSGSGSVPLGAGRIAERRYGRIAIVRDRPAPLPAREIALAVPGRTAYGEAVVQCSLGAAEGALDTALAGALVLRAPRAGERLPGARRTIARMLLEAHVPRSERARYPVVAAHGEPVALPGIAVAAALRRPSGLVLTLAAT